MPAFAGRTTGQADFRHPALGVGWDRGADRASNDADVSSIPPIIPYWHAVLSDPGEFDIDNFQNVDVDFGLRRVLNGSALPNIPAIRFTRGACFRAFTGSPPLRPVRLLAPLYGSD